jgi:hypothetical protein
LPEILTTLLKNLFIEKIKTSVGVELNVEVIGGGSIGFKEKRLIILVDDK